MKRGILEFELEFWGFDWLFFYWFSFMLVEIVSSVLFAKTSFAIGVTIAIETSKIDIYNTSLQAKSYLPTHENTHANKII